MTTVPGRAFGKPSQHMTPRSISTKQIYRRLKAAGLPAMDCIEKFLDDHGVDTSDFQNQMQLINNSVSNIGTIQAANAFVGGQGNIISGHGAVNNFGGGQAALNQGRRPAGIP